MPCYEYHCRCGKSFDEIVPFNTNKMTCPECGRKAKRVFSSQGGSFTKGEGHWPDGRFGNDNAT